MQIVFTFAVSITNNAEQHADKMSEKMKFNEKIGIPEKNNFTSVLEIAVHCLGWQGGTFYQAVDAIENMSESKRIQTLRRMQKFVAKSEIKNGISIFCEYLIELEKRVGEIQLSKN